MTIPGAGGYRLHAGVMGGDGKTVQKPLFFNFVTGMPQNGGVFVAKPSSRV